MSDTSMPQNLRLLLEHLHAVRELYRYLHNKGVDKDVERYVKEGFRPAIEERVPKLRDWHFDPNGSCASWYPDSWEVLDEHVSLCVMLPGPLDPDDDNPSVNLYVPTDWSGYCAFSDRSTPFIKALLGDRFGLAVDHDWMETYPIGKYVSWLKLDGSFDENNLVERIAVEVEKIVCLEAEITETIRRTPGKSVPKKTKGRLRTAKPKR